MPNPAASTRDPGLQPERTALSWRRTIMSVIAADILIWRGWLHALTKEYTGSAPVGLFSTGLSDHVVGLGIAAIVACLTTMTLVACAVGRIRVLRAGVGQLEMQGDIAPSPLMLRTASAAIVALAVAAIGALVLGM